MQPGDENKPPNVMHILWAIYDQLLEINKLLPLLIEQSNANKSLDPLGPITVGFERLREVMKPRRKYDFR